MALTSEVAKIPTPKEQLLGKLARREARVAILGLGYVGLPLAMEFAKAGFRVTGVDVDAKKVALLNAGASHLADVPHARVSNAIRNGTFNATTDFSALVECDAISICVPTPLSKTGAPDVSHIINAVDSIARYLHPGMVVVLESTTYPGTTSEIVLPALTAGSLQLTAGENLFVAYSPERLDVGRLDWNARTTPKVIGGVTADCLEVASAFYSVAVDTLVPVSSPAAAEMVKILENTFRAVNIGLVNEVLLMCDKLGLDVWEIVEAAGTKPYGFMKFMPGPGLGGHCIPIDPLYLSWKLKTLDYTARFIELSSEINASMPRYWVQKAQDALNDLGKPVKGSSILVLGLAFKRDVDDVRESPALDIIHLLVEKGAKVSYHDPIVNAPLAGEGQFIPDERLFTALRSADCVVIATDHSAYDWTAIRRDSQLVVDTRGVLFGSNPPDSMTARQVTMGNGEAPPSLRRSLQTEEMIAARVSRE